MHRRSVSGVESRDDDSGGGERTRGPSWCEFQTRFPFLFDLSTRGWVCSLFELLSLFYVSSVSFCMGFVLELRPVNKIIWQKKKKLDELNCI